ncbi:D-hexose-6-phosphate mutarotase [Thalassotalea insulae]|uniref:Putative glucose-6-phosphate 1-epimerase n=1 Tax=Thalassotalea insulae TaxID=2056778 RepID=A0ABQ6GTQ0_9GAMM|nr:D-hexose-6-phosphate mutarotase [Thalassotalea insulae]GLX79320.1 D-hexose-6-phosphate mutarotase [Thalassotalea insulae]
MTQELIQSNQYGAINQRKINDIAILDISHVNHNASLSLYGGQVLSWQPSGEQEVFWLSDSADFSYGKAIRGGIPICWPWFGANLDEQGINGGNHGFARTSLWQLIDSEINKQGVSLTLELVGEDRHPLWPAQFKVTQQLFFGSEFSQQLTMENLSNQDVQYTTAVHSYFAVSAPENVTAPELSSVYFDDKLTGLSAQQTALVNCVGPIDRIYHTSENQQIIDAQWQRKILIETQHCQQYVLWNPGKETASTMDDIHTGGENEYVCLEAANTNWQLIKAGEQTSIKQKVSLESL